MAGPIEAGRLFVDPARQRRGGLWLPPDLVADERVGPGSALCWAVLRNLPSVRDRGLAWPGIGWLAERLGVSRRSVPAYLTQLHNAGWITIEPVPGETSNYRIHDAPVARAPVKGRRTGLGRLPATHANSAGGVMQLLHGGSCKSCMGVMQKLHGSMEGLRTEEEKAECVDPSAVVAVGPGPEQPPLAGLAGPAAVDVAPVRQAPGPLNGYWLDVLERVRPEVTPETFATWLANTRAVAHVGDVFTIAAPSTFAREWIETRYRRPLEKALGRSFGRPTRLEVRDRFDAT